ncbi:sugar ABC transporter substrate-binding protein [Actinokineospora sp. HBU206404]|uniref:Sugar ABC transporter substrate-binding protein n=2 Tax=Actinokineospora xionganensis TaxID=2684470 RepID=A0ABR7LEJ2_9PSEU|nr:sugar ABC transporter substrate-binding protein [Actinokineospora xionganensis]
MPVLPVSYREPSFLPLTVATASGHPALHPPATRADAAAAECWTALLAGCDTAGRSLPGRLRELADATSTYAGAAWWNGDGACHRGRIDRARARIEEAVADRDGADFAEAFVGFDQAVATALVRVNNRMRSPAR